VVAALGLELAVVVVVSEFAEGDRQGATFETPAWVVRFQRAAIPALD
jgi:hypothetical protein